MHNIFIINITFQISSPYYGWHFQMTNYKKKIFRNIKLSNKKQQQNWLMCKKSLISVYRRSCFPKNEYDILKDKELN